MTKLLMPTAASLGIVCVVATTADAGPVWCEATLGDAGSLPGSAQVPFGLATLSLIEGTLQGFVGAPAPVGADFEDVYLIFVEDPAAFRVTTDMDDPVLIGLGPFASFNSQLWLFRPDPLVPADALGLLGNNDTPDGLPGSPASLLVPVPSDGEPPLAECGLYYLAISGFDNVPVGAGGDIFDLLSLTEISGPDGPGGGDFHSGWTAPATPATGFYRIAMAGARFPGPCLADCTGDGLVNVVDLLALLANWEGTPSCACDFDGGGIGVTDLLFLLATWGCVV